MDKEIERLTKELSKLKPGTDDYEKVLDEIKKLSEATELVSRNAKKPLSWDAIMNAIVGISQMGMVIGFEKTGGIFTGKAFSLIRKR